MISIQIVTFFILGLIVGSFLNVVIYRYNTGRSIHIGRSMCMSCGKNLKWYELIPVVSFVLQRSRCRGCGASISWQYPVVELLSGALFVLSFLHVQVTSQSLLPLLLSSIFFLLIISLLIVITVYDIRHTIIPDPFVFAFIILSGVTLFFNFPTLSFRISDIWHFAAGPIFAAPFALLWLVSNGRWMGFGDAKLAWGIGWLLGLSGGLSAILFGFWTGALYGIIAIFFSTLFGRRRGFTIKSEVPFAPFLIFGITLVLFFDFNAFALIDIFV